MSDQGAFPHVDGVEFRLADGNQGYCVGDNGSVWSRVKRAGRGKIKFGEWTQLKPSPQYRGHMTVWLGRKNQRFVHRLVLEAFRGPCPEGMECLHGDGVPANNNLWNLKWGTPKQNHEDSVRHGTAYCVSGKFCPTYTLGEEQVKSIVEMCRNGATQTKAAEFYGVHSTNVNAIMTGRSWSYLTGIKYNPKTSTRKGSKRTKLTDDQVAAIRSSVDLTTRSGTSARLAKEFGVTEAAIRMIAKGERRRTTTAANET